LYEYECSSCHHRFEKIESFSASEKKDCPKCGKVAKRVLAPAAIQFKGSGWYVTDYARKGTSPAATSTTGSAEKTASAGTESKAPEKASSDKKD
jgi:putative FmdB family regulatory protein